MFSIITLFKAIIYIAIPGFIGLLYIRYKEKQAKAYVRKVLHTLLNNKNYMAQPKAIEKQTYQTKVKPVLDKVTNVFYDAEFKHEYNFDKQFIDEFLTN